MTTTDRTDIAELHRKRWLESTDVEVLGEDDARLAELRADMEQRYAAWQETEALVTETAAERRRLMARTTDAKLSADERQDARDALRDVKLRAADLPDEVGVLAGRFAESLTEWSRYVERRAEQVREHARQAESSIADGLPQPQLLSGRRSEKATARREKVERVMAEARPQIDRQRAAQRLVREVQRRRKAAGPTRGLVGRPVSLGGRAQTEALERLSGLSTEPLQSAA